MTDSIMRRVMGGSPVGVLIRLFLVSLLVGAIMSWLDIDPEVLFDWVQASVMQLWFSGFRSLHEVGRYVLTGAAVVIPIWLLLRLTSMGTAFSPRPSGPSRWTLPGGPEGDGQRSRVRTEPRD